MVRTGWVVCQYVSVDGVKSAVSGMVWTARMDSANNVDAMDKVGRVAGRWCGEHEHMDSVNGWAPMRAWMT